MAIRTLRFIVKSLRRFFSKLERMKGIQKESQSSIACSISKAITQVNFRHGNHFFTGLF